MNHQILIASYPRDFPWLRQCLRSIQEYQHGFCLPTVVVQDHEVPEAREVCAGMANVRAYNAKHGFGMLRAQIVMCRADELCPDADFIYLVGSDCLFFDHFDRGTYFRDGKPLMLYTSYAALNRNGGSNALHWSFGVHRALGFQPQHEFMRRLPIVYPRQVFAGLRSYIETTHRQPFDDFVYDDRLKRHNNFSESNVLGAYAWKHMPDVYTWLLTDDPGWEAPSPLAQFWSHGGFDKPAECCVEYRPGKNVVGRTPREVITEVLGSF